MSFLRMRLRRDKLGALEIAIDTFIAAVCEDFHGREGTQGWMGEGVEKVRFPHAWPSTHLEVNDQ